jgi:hypothetical protein
MSVCFLGVTCVLILQLSEAVVHSVRTYARRKVETYDGTCD